MNAINKIYTLVLCLLISTYNLYAQEQPVISKEESYKKKMDLIGLPDTLIYHRELRLSRFAISGPFQEPMLHLYQKDDKQWVVEYYSDILKKGGTKSALTFKKDLVPHTKNITDYQQYIWELLCNTYVLYMPTEAAIRYKTQKRHFNFENDQLNYFLSSNGLLDGVFYELRIKEFKKTNTIFYTSPEVWLNANDTKDIDEYRYFVDFLKIINQEFNIEF